LRCAEFGQAAADSSDPADPADQDVQVGRGVVVGGDAEGNVSRQEKIATGSRTAVSVSPPGR
jgi:hypothetical protein